LLGRGRVSGRLLMRFGTPRRCAGRYDSSHPRRLPTSCARNHRHDRLDSRRHAGRLRASRTRVRSRKRFSNSVQYLSSGESLSLIGNAGNLQRDPVSARTPASNGAECQPRRACATRADHHESIAVAVEVTSDTADVCVGASVGVLDYPVGSDDCRRHSNRARNRAASAELCACGSRRRFGALEGHLGRRPRPTSDRLDRTRRGDRRQNRAGIPPGDPQGREPCGGAVA